MGMSQDMKDTTAALEADSAVSEEVKACDPRRMGSWLQARELGVSTKKDTDNAIIIMIHQSFQDVNLPSPSVFYSAGEMCGHGHRLREARCLATKKWQDPGSKVSRAKVSRAFHGRRSSPHFFGSWNSRFLVVAYPLRWWPHLCPLVFFPPQCSIPNWVKPLEICRKYQTSTWFVCCFNPQSLLFLLVKLTFEQFRTNFCWFMPIWAGSNHHFRLLNPFFCS